MMAVYSALGLFDDRKDRSSSAPVMDPTKPHKRRSWYTSKLTPFAGQMVVERLKCRQKNDQSKLRVRILVNDAVVPLPFCGDSGDGICDLEAFVQRIEQTNYAGKVSCYILFGELMMTRLPFIPGFRQNLFRIYSIINPLVMRHVTIQDIYTVVCFLASGRWR